MADDEKIKTFCPFTAGERNLCQSNCGLAIEGVDDEGKYYYQCAIELIAVSVATAVQLMMDNQSLINDLQKESENGIATSENKGIPQT